MGIALAIAFYASAAIFLWKVIWRFIIWLRAGSPEPRAAGRPGRGFFEAAVDIVFLTRLFRVNAGLWWGEWLFHVSFVVVFARHLVFFFDPVPGWVAALQPFGVAAGYVLPVSLVYIFVWRFAVEKREYFSRYNLFLTLVLLALALTGLMLRLLWRVDLVDVKVYMAGVLAFGPAAELPGGWLLLLHLILFLVLLPALPTHIFTAPLTLLEARRREGDRPLHG
jgi:nitrate reductase gamma subunit